MTFSPNAGRFIQFIAEKAPWMSVLVLFAAILIISAIVTGLILLAL